MTSKYQIEEIPVHYDDTSYRLLLEFETIIGTMKNNTGYDAADLSDMSDEDLEKISEDDMLTIANDINFGYDEERRMMQLFSEDKGEKDYKRNEKWSFKDFCQLPKWGSDADALRCFFRSLVIDVQFLR